MKHRNFACALAAIVPLAAVGCGSGAASDDAGAGGAADGRTVTHFFDDGGDDGGGADDAGAGGADAAGVPTDGGGGAVVDAGAGEAGGDGAAPSDAGGGGGADAGPDADATAEPDAGPAQNGTCAAAMPVFDSAILRNQRVADGGAPYLSCLPEGASGTIGEPLYYEADLAAGDTLLVTTAVTAGGAPMRIFLRGSCTEGACYRPGYEDAASFAYTNRSGRPQGMVFGLAPAEPERYRGSTFDLAVRILPPAPNSVCEMATPVADGARLAGENTAVGADPSPVCGVITAGPALFYRASVPPRATLAARATAAGGGCPVLLRLVDDCRRGAACLDTPTTGAHSFTNASDAPRDVVLVASCQDRATAVFDLDVSVAVAP